MADNKMLQAILDSVAGLRGYIDEKIGDLRSELRADIARLETKIDKVDERVDRIGKQLAYLEDDIPTRHEYDRLEKRVGVCEQKLAQA